MYYHSTSDTLPSCPVLLPTRNVKLAIQLQRVAIPGFTGITSTGGRDSHPIHHESLEMNRVPIIGHARAKHQ